MPPPVISVLVGLIAAARMLHNADAVVQTCNIHDLLATATDRVECAVGCFVNVDPLGSSGCEMCPSEQAELQSQPSCEGAPKERNLIQAPTRATPAEIVTTLHPPAAPALGAGNDAGTVCATWNASPRCKQTRPGPVPPSWSTKKTRFHLERL